MIEAWTVAEVRAAEESLMATMAPGRLMQRAATGLAHACARELGRTAGRVYGGRVLLLIGTGNNGADALWAGAQLAHRGAQVTAVCHGEPVADALAALLRAGGRRAQGPAGSYDLVVDGLLGIGSTGELRPGVAALLARGLAAGRTSVAVDLPTGVDADTGRRAAGAATVDLTVTLGSYKPGLLLDRAGRVELVDIGLRPHLTTPGVRALEAADVGTGVASDPGLDKYRRGVLGVAAGSQVYPGAAVLCVGAALAAGAGMIRFVGGPHAAGQVRTSWPEVVVTEATGSAVVTAGRVQAWVVGPGLGTDEGAAETVRAVLAQDVPVLVDADALTICAQHPQWLRERSAPTVLTPHDREYARFGREVGADRIGAARALAADLGVVVLLKGSATVVAAATGAALVNRTGSPALATAGAGDVLSGGVGALLALGLDPAHAAASGAWLHGLAGTLSAAGAATTAQRVLAAWPDAVRAAAAERIGA